MMFTMSYLAPIAWLPQAQAVPNAAAPRPGAKDGPGAPGKAMLTRRARRGIGWTVFGNNEAKAGSPDPTWRLSLSATVFGVWFHAGTPAFLKRRPRLRRDASRGFQRIDGYRGSLVADAFGVRRPAVAWAGNGQAWGGIHVPLKRNGDAVRLFGAYAGAALDDRRLFPRTPRKRKSDGRPRGPVRAGRRRSNGTPITGFSILADASPAWTTNVDSANAGRPRNRPVTPIGKPF